MTPRGRPKFEVVVPAEIADRRLVSVATIREITGIPSTGAGAVTDEALGRLIDGALAQAARSCRLAAYRAIAPTLALETVRASWLPDCWDWWPRQVGWKRDEPSTLLLPWRAPIVSIEITEGETDLVEDNDFRLLGAGVVERINGCWATGGSIVADYIAGFVPLADDPVYQVDGEPMPADLVSLLADQVRMSKDRGAIDLNLRSEDIPGIWAGSFNVPGGDSIDTGGLLMPLYDALAPYRAPPSLA